VLEYRTFSLWIFVLLSAILYLERRRRSDKYLKSTVTEWWTNEDPFIYTIRLLPII
jgi:hypothetical protein